MDWPLLRFCFEWSIYKLNCFFQPYWIAELPSDDVVEEIARRSVSLKHITELWAMSSTVENLHEQVKKFNNDYLIHRTDLHRISFKFNVEVYCNTQRYSEKVAKIEVRKLRIEARTCIFEQRFLLEVFRIVGTEKKLAMWKILWKFKNCLGFMNFSFLN